MAMAAKVVFNKRSGHQIDPNLVSEPIFSTEQKLVQGAVKEVNYTFAALAALAVTLPLMAAWLPMPKWVRFTSILGGVAASGGACLVQGQGARVSKLASTFEKAQTEQLKNKLTYEIVTAKFEAEITEANKLLERVKKLPSEQQPYWLKKFGLSQLVAPPTPPVIDPTITVGSTLSPGVLNQGNMESQRVLAMASMLDTTWFKGWTARSGAVCGESFDGKSFLLKYCVADFMQVHPNGKVYICDIDYGSSHPDTAPNNWFKLAVGEVVFNKPETCAMAIETVANEVRRRAEETAERTEQGLERLEYEPVLLVIDESKSLYAALDSKQQGQYTKNISDILVRGLKQGGITFKIGSQSLASGKTGLGQDILSQVEAVFLWRAAQVKLNYDNLNLSPKDELDQLIAIISTLPQKVGNVYAAISWTGKKLKLAGIPQIKFEDPKPVSADPWTKEFKEKYVEENQPQDEKAKFAKLLQYLEDFKGEITKEDIITAHKIYLDREPGEQIVDYLIVTVKETKLVKALAKFGEDVGLQDVIEAYQALIGSEPDRTIAENLLKRINLEVKKGTKK